jgi:uncharacterized membrane protein YccC
MMDLVKAANETCDLNELFEIKSPEVLEIILEIILQGWWVFTALTVILSLSGLAFGASVSAFLLSPAGIMIAVIVGVSASAVLWKLYRNRELPIAIKEVGSKYKPLYEQIQNSEKKTDVRHQKIDSLLEDGVIALVSKAKALSNQQRQDLRKNIRKFFGMN